MEMKPRTQGWKVILIQAGGFVQGRKPFKRFSDRILHSVAKSDLSFRDERLVIRAGPQALGPTPRRPLCIVARAIIK